ncbi:MAG: hypothetical protein QM736_08700 [Vicinamibacterales bacterium]
MRTYSEEKRSGHDRAAAHLATHRHARSSSASSSVRWRSTRVMLLVTLLHVGILFAYGNPEWKPIVTDVPRSAAARRLLHLGGSASSRASRRIRSSLASVTFGVS